MKKKFRQCKRISALFLSLAMTITAIPPSAAVYAAEETAEAADSVIESNYEESEPTEPIEGIAEEAVTEEAADTSVMSIAEATDVHETVLGATVQFKGQSYYTDEAVIAQLIRDAILNRETELTVYYAVPAAAEDPDISTYIDAVTTNNSAIVEGDYVKNQGFSYKYKSEASGDGTYWYWTIPVDFSYFTTAEQESSVDEKVKEIIDGFNFTEKTTDYEKIYAVHNWLAQNVSYDQEAADAEEAAAKAGEEITDYSAHTAWAALVRDYPDTESNTSHKAVCQGYSMAMYRLLRELGIEVRYVTGFGGDSSEPTRTSNHGWNLVRLGDAWYFCDATWDTKIAEDVAAGNYDYQYFLRGIDDLDDYDKNMKDGRTITLYGIHELMWEESANYNIASTRYVPTEADFSTDDGEDDGEEDEDTDTDTATYGETKYATTYAQAAAWLKAAMKERKASADDTATSITIPVAVKDYSDSSTIATDILQIVLEHDESDDEAGDYIARSYYSWKRSKEIVESEAAAEDGYTLVNITYLFNFYLTKDQETQLTEEIDAWVAENISDSMTEYEKFLKIYNYICTNSTYDESEDDATSLSYNAYNAWFKNSAKCQGFATLLYRMLLKSGIDNRLVTGSANDINQVDHVWNIVKIGNRYYNVDATWDCERNESTYQFMLKCDANFGAHYRNHESDSVEFREKYPMATSDYSSNIVYDDHVHSYNVTFTWADDYESAAVNYTCSECDTKGTDTAEVTAVNYGDFSSIYTASYTIEDKKYTDVKVVPTKKNESVELAIDESVTYLIDGDHAEEEITSDVVTVSAKKISVPSALPVGADEIVSGSSYYIGTTNGQFLAYDSEGNLTTVTDVLKASQFVVRYDKASEQYFIKNGTQQKYLYVTKTGTTLDEKDGTLLYYTSDGWVRRAPNTSRSFSYNSTDDVWHVKSGSKEAAAYLFDVAEATEVTLTAKAKGEDTVTIGNSVYIVTQKDKRYNITLETTGDSGGSASVAKTSISGNWVRVAPNPYTGFAVDSVDVITSDGTNVETQKLENGYYIFQMPASDVTVVVNFIAYEEVTLAVGDSVAVSQTSTLTSAEASTLVDISVESEIDSVSDSSASVIDETVVGAIGDGTNYIKITDGTIENTTDSSEASIWTAEAYIYTDGIVYYKLRSGDYYLNFSKNSLLHETSFTIFNADALLQLVDFKDRVLFYDDGWKMSSSPTSTSYGKVYLVKYKNTVNFTGLAAGETILKVGDTNYKITVQEHETIEVDVDESATIEIPGAYTDEDLDVSNVDADVEVTTVYEKVDSLNYTISSGYITDGTYYMAVENDQLTSTTNIEEATLWTINTYVLSTDGKVYYEFKSGSKYLARSNGSAVLSSSKTVFKADVSAGLIDYAGAALSCQNGTWTFTSEDLVTTAAESTVKAPAYVYVPKSTTTITVKGTSYGSTRITLGNKVIDFKTAKNLELTAGETQVILEGEDVEVTVEENDTVKLNQTSYISSIEDGMEIYISDGKGHYLSADGENAFVTGASAATKWIIEKSTDHEGAYRAKAANGMYLGVSTSKPSLNDSGLYFKYEEGKIKYFSTSESNYGQDSGYSVQCNGTTFFLSKGSNTAVKFYEQIPSVSITGLKAGTVDVTIGTTKYSVKVYAAGDMNRDGSVDLLDAVLLKQSISKGDTYSAAADVDGDGSVTAKDAEKLCQIIAGI